MLRNTLIKASFLLLAFCIFFGAANAQAPHKMTFQAVVRNSAGTLVTSTTVGMQVSILYGTSTGTAIYVERQTPVTNANGLATILIGTGTVVSGSFDSVHWANGPFYLKAEIDPTGGTTYTIASTQQLVSVPYALYAEHSGDTGVGTKPTVHTDSVRAIAFTTATFYGSVLADGGELILFKGVCIDTVAMPSIGNSFITPGSALGSYWVNTTGLIPNKRYHVRAFATNSNGTSYGDTLSFMTLPLTIPTVTTDTITGISNISANGGGNVTSDGGTPVTARGICWNTTGSPTITDFIAPSGTGTGHFLTTLSSLTPSTTYYARAYATNALGTAYGNTDTFVTIVYTYATISTDTVNPIYYTTAVSGVNVLSDGGSTITAQGICWSTTVNPTIANPHQNTATGLGDYPASMYSLTPATTYYVRAFCTNGTGTVYGAQRVFTSLPLSLPIITTNSVIGVTAASATSGGHISMTGGSFVSARGVCWGVSTTPTIDSAHTVDGVDTGIYNSNLIGLNPVTTYYVRAYATNSSGTAYGALISFTTDSIVVSTPSLPVVGTNIPTMTTTSTASDGGYVLLDGGSTVTARGICWGSSPLPTISGSHTTDGSGLGYFSSVMTGLSGCGTIYYVRSYATNSIGTGYGNQYVLSTGLPLTLVSNAITSITPTSAIAGGNVTGDGGCPITQRGVVYEVAYDTSSTFLPSFTSSYTIITYNGTGTGSYTSTLTGLHPNVKYHLRTYATNSIGTVYGPLQVFTTTVPTTHYIGENYAGGYIFYLDSTGNHGLVCSPTEIGSYYDASDWGCLGTLISGTDTSFGTGATNTAAIVAGCTDTVSAAYQCANLIQAGYSDWFLPSLDELNVIYNNLFLYGITNLYSFWEVGYPYPDSYTIVSRDDFWSSSEFDNNNVWAWSLDEAVMHAKNENHSMIPVRRF